MQGDIFATYEHVYEVVNIVLGIIILCIGIPLLASLRFELQKKGMVIFITGASLFALSEAIGLLDYLFSDHQVIPEWAVEIFTETIESGFVISMAFALKYLATSNQGEVIKLKTQANIDSLTKLYNANYYRSSGDDLFVAAVNDNSPLSVALIDIDNFKSYNDHFGHEAGNVAIAAVAECLATVSRHDTLIARYGGEEFIVISPSDADASMAIASRLQQLVSERCSPATNAELQRQLTISVGVASLANETSLTQLVEQADKALYQAKSNGKNQVCIA